MVLEKQDDEFLTGGEILRREDEDDLPSFLEMQRNKENNTMQRMIEVSQKESIL